MKKATRLIALLACLALLVSAAAGCAPPAATQSTADAGGDTPAGSTADGGSTAATGEKILKFSQTVEPESMDPQLANSMATQTLLSHVFEPLMRVNDGNVEHAAAESYEMSEDGTVYTFTLRDGLLWSDGEPLTAEHYVYGFQRFLDPAVASPFAFYGMVIKNAAAVNAGEMAVEELGITAPDEKTVEITLEYPAAYFLGMLGTANFSPARPDIVEAQGTAFGASAESNVYCGPFVLSSWTINDRSVLTKNENYWNADAVKLDGVEVLTILDNNTALGMYEAGDLHFTEIPVAVASNYPDADHYYSGGNDYVKLNHRDGYDTRSRELRLALNYGLNRGEYIALATNNVYEANQRFVLPQVHGVDGEYGTEYPLEFWPMEGDLDKAKEHLDAALTELGFTDPAQIEIELLASDADTARTEAEVIQSQWQTNLGITVNIRQVDYRQRLNMEADHDFEAVLTGWGPDYSDPLTYLELWTTDSPYNHAGYSSAEYDAAMAASNLETDAKARMDLLFEAEQIFLGDGVVVPQQYRRIPYLQNENVTGFSHYFVGVQHNFVYADIT